jgi:hypothetical protein
MEKLRLFIAAAFMAALTGCPTPNPMPDSDTGTPPGDSGMPEVDSGTDPVDAGVDAYVPPGEDGGVDSGTVADVCEDVDYVGYECNLPFGMTYNRDGFICESFINGDLWLSDAVGATPRGTAYREVGGQFLALLPFVNANSGLLMPAAATEEFTCGPEGRCWLNWFNPDSNYSHCRVSFTADCGDATTECWMPGSSDPITSYATYVGE